MQETENGDYEWKPGGHPLGKGHESVDILGQSSRKGCKLVLVEVELRKDAPLTNVVKVWRWVVNEKFKTPFVLVQAFSKYYRQGDTKRSNAEFVGERMQGATKNAYLTLSFKYNPYRHGRHGAGRRRHHAYLLANQIRGRLKKIL
jgi:hypothetical protein